MAKQVVAGEYQVDFTYKGQRIRGSIPCEILVALITGEQAGLGMANLGDQGVIPFDKFVEEHYLPRHAKPNKRPSAYDADLCSIVWLKQFFGDKPVHLITKGMREDYKQRRLSGELSAKGVPCAGNTVNKDLSCLNQIMEYAREIGYIKENPLVGLRRLPPVHREQFWLTTEQLDDLLRAAAEYEGGRYLGFIEFVAYTGARRNEALAFRKSDINWARKEVRLVTLKKRKRKNAERFLSIKDIGPRLEGLLQRLKPHPETGYFFATRTGSPIQGHNLNRAFIRIRKKAKLDQFRVHDLRHYADFRIMPSHQGCPSGVSFLTRHNPG